MSVVQGSGLEGYVSIVQESGLEGYVSVVQRSGLEGWNRLKQIQFQSSYRGKNDSIIIICFMHAYIGSFIWGKLVLYIDTHLY